MRKAAFAVLFSCATILLTGNSAVSAEAREPGQIIPKNKHVEAALVLERINKASDTVQVAATKAPKAEVPVEHLVKEGDSLAKIAEAHQTTWKRLYDKNEQIASPDIITVGLKVVIPKPDEVLTERALPQPVAAAPEPSTTVSRNTGHTSAPATTYRYARGSSAGNTYTPGYCTWYVKNMRPDLPNNLGNADTWVARAAAQGLPTGSAPRVGAVGQQGMHVVYVQSVNGDGTVTISEMNYGGLYRINTRTVPASSFMYIY